MKYLGVIAAPGKPSLSPVLQQAALDALRLDIVYEAWPTPPDGLPTRIRGLRSADVLGANVTIPHKEAVIPLLDELEDTARRTGAVNTIVNHEGQLSGHNTDVEGFLRALREDGGLQPAGCRALIAGAGGAARAVVTALIDSAANSVAVINRSFPRASRLVEEMRQMAGSTLLVNCTPAGSASGPEGEESAVPLDVIHSGMLVYDLVYLPAETPLLAAARQRGARMLGGLPMLVYQGAASFQLWTGREAPVDIMREAATAALSETGAPK